MRPLWSARRSAPGIVLLVLGGLCCLAAAIGVRRSALLADQVGLAALSVIGVVVAAAGAVLWFLDGRRTVAVRASVVLAEYSELSALESAVSPATIAGPGGTPVGIPTYVVVRSRALYHRPGCPLTTGRLLTDAPSGPGFADRYSPCPVCEP
ncbi:MAG TPA: hypothetical protein VHL53_07855 [Acidimicrobiia bacterium]|nr:hypothetical protein [Acidimicrobiia bacterium]